MCAGLTAVVVYVEIPGAGRICGRGGDDIVPVFPERHTFDWVRSNNSNPDGVEVVRVTRMQLPLLPAYCFTDYKAQGRSLEYAILDLKSVKSVQGAYVMLSRVKNVRGMAILRPFRQGKVFRTLAGEVREELARLDSLNRYTADWHQRGMRQRR